MVTGAEGIARAEHQSEVSNKKHDLRSVPQAGDVVASRPTGRADLFTISIVPATAHLSAARHSEAIETVRALARDRNLDGWFTATTPTMRASRTSES